MNGHTHGTIGASEYLFDASQLGHAGKADILNGIVQHLTCCLTVLHIDALSPVHGIVGL